MRKSHWISLGIAFTIAILCVGLEQRRGHYFQNPSADPSKADKAAFFMQRAEWATLDARFKLRGRQAPSDDIVIISIDDRSLKELHQWPWPRGIHAKLIRTLEKTPPKALLFDVFFIDPFTSSPEGDQALVRATRDNPWVIHSFYCDYDGKKITNKTYPLPALAAAARRLGFVNAVIDEDGMLRSAIPRLSDGSATDWLLSVLGASLYKNQSPDDLLRTMPVDKAGHMLVRYSGPEHTFIYVSYVDVLSGELPASALAGKVVLVGAQATGTYDHYPTPLSKNMPGVEFHANVIENLIQNQALSQAPLRWTYLMIALAALFCGLLLSRFSAWLGAVLTVGLGLIYGGVAQWLFVRRGIVIDMAGPLMTLALVYVAIVIYRFFTEEREKRMVKSFFSQQVSGELLEVLMDNPNILKNAGERREMTVFFSDVAGFTSISERLQPEELVDLLNQYLTSMTEVIFQNGGYVDKYMGDGIMAFWNGLLKQPDHAERACRCALQSVTRLHDLNEDLKKRGLVPLGARIGVNTGAMAAGYMGSVQKKQFTVMGDNVNLGSRLEGANKAFGSSVMISEFTYDMVQDKFEVRFLDKIRVPGKAKPVKVFELLAEKGGLSPEWQKAHTLYHDAIMLFVNREFSKAREKFLEVSTILGQDKACMAYVERAEAFMARPPAQEWDGVFEVKSK